MRWLVSLGLVSLSGCFCSIPAGEPDECFDDSDCPDTDDEYCNGVPVCEIGVFGGGRWCSIRPPCGEGGQHCDEETDSCRFDDDAGSDRDAGPACRSGSGELGWECGAGGCTSDLRCIPPLTARRGPVTRTFRSLCSATCDPGGDPETECGPCAACVDSMRLGSERVDVAEVRRAPYCALRCEPQRRSPGCEREGFSCDVVTGTCQDACESDRECRLVRDASGAWIEDPTRTHVCDPLTGRCRSPGTEGAAVGDPCSTDADCPMDGVCLRGEGWPETGYCATLDCQWSALSCGEGERCHRRALDRPACLVACTVGTEPEGDRLGAGGHGDGCAPGLSCRWDGRRTAAGPNGGCVPGNYNDVAAPNLGAPCTRDDECYSPFGLGRCAWSESGAGTCSLIDCGDAYPLIPCGDGASCVAVGDDALCLRSCAAASDCAAGQACAPSPTGARVCAPSCTADADCRAGERCEGVECTFAGACRCVAS